MKKHAGPWEAAGPAFNKQTPHKLWRGPGWRLPPIRLQTWLRIQTGEALTNLTTVIYGAILLGLGQNPYVFTFSRLGHTKYKKAGAASFSRLMAYKLNNVIMFCKLRDVFKVSANSYGFTLRLCRRVVSLRGIATLFSNVVFPRITLSSSPPPRAFVSQHKPWRT